MAFGGKYVIVLFTAFHYNLFQKMLLVLLNNIMNLRFFLISFPLNTISHEYTERV
jgi:hypothetical protein